ncbi:F-box/LRR-repeat protein 25-like protein [Tanacetum coccineum]
MFILQLSLFLLFLFLRKKKVAVIVVSMVKHHQSRSKTIRFTDKQEDYISLLPDCLLIDIISRLPETKEAIRTGTLSKRWQHLWLYVSNLIFIDTNYYQLNKNFVSFVDKTLTQRCQSNLHKFQIHTSYVIQFEPQVNWIRYAISCNVQHLDLSLPKFVLDQYMFINSCFTHLKLKLRCCVINPTAAISWSKLASLSISEADLSEDLIQNILSGCPLLETLELKYCYGFRRVDITSKSVQNFVFSGYMDNEYEKGRIYGIDDVIEINAPYIVSLTIANGLWLSKLLLVDVSCLVKAHLDYQKYGHYEPAHVQSQIMSQHEETLKGLILSLHHVKELKIGESCLKVLSRLEAKGFTFPSNVEHPDWPDYDSSESEDWSDNDSTEWRLVGSRN